MLDAAQQERVNEAKCHADTAYEYIVNADEEIGIALVRALLSLNELGRIAQENLAPSSIASQPPWPWEDEPT